MSNTERALPQLERVTLMQEKTMNKFELPKLTTIKITYVGSAVD